MNPQKVALITNSTQLHHSVKNTLGRNEKLLVSDIVTETNNSSIVILHHDPPFNSYLEYIPSLKRKKPDCPVVVIGTTSAPHDIAEAFRLGASDYLFYPMSDDVLLTCLHRHRLNLRNETPLKWYQKWLPWWKSISEKPMAIVSEENQRSHITMEGLLEKPDLEIQFFGNLSLIFQGKPIEKMPGKKAKSLMAYLLYNYPKPVHRDILMEKFWGDSTHDSARNCLNVTLHAIRKCFGQATGQEDIIVYDNERYRIREDITVERDIDLFNAYWKKGQQLEQLEGIQAATDTFHQAFAFYRGDFLEDLMYEDWATAFREKYREVWLVILDRLSVHFYEKGKFQVSKNLCQKMVEKDPCLEDVHRRIMDCYAKMKMPDMAIRQFHKCRDVLKKELNVTPGKATWDLFLNIRNA